MLLIYSAKGLTLCKSNRRSNFLMLVLLSMVRCSYGVAQDTVAPDSQVTEWNFIKEVDNVKFFYAKGQCESRAFLFLRIENMNSSQVRGAWMLKVTVAGETDIYVGALLNMNGMSVRSASCAVLDPHLAIPQVKDLSDVTVSIDAELMKR